MVLTIRAVFRSLAAFLALAACVSIADATELHFSLVTRDVVERRLRAYGGDDSARQATIKTLFEEAGCGTSSQLTEQMVKSVQQANVVCNLPGETDEVIVVGAHYDHVEPYGGVVDNWSGASLLPSPFQAIHHQPRHFTYTFVAFTGEVKGLEGSHFFVSKLSRRERSRIRAMVNLDTLGLGPTEVWVSRSDSKLARLLVALAFTMKLPISGMNVDQVGYSDEESFASEFIPVIMVHSLTQKTLSVLHSRFDNYEAVRFDDYYNSYHLLSAYLAYLDSALGSEKEARKKSRPN